MRGFFSRVDSPPADPSLDLSVHHTNSRRHRPPRPALPSPCGVLQTESGRGSCPPLPCQPPSRTGGRLSGRGDEGEEKETSSQRRAARGAQVRVEGARSDGEDAVRSVNGRAWGAARRGAI